MNEMTPYPKDGVRPRFGFTDEELATLPTVYRDDLLKGQVVLVSGGGSGIGKGITFLAARLGADVVICGRTPERLDSPADALERATGRRPMTVGSTTPAASFRRPRWTSAPRAGRRWSTTTSTAPGS